MDLWIDAYGSTTYLISYNDLILSNIYFISEEFKNEFKVLVDLGLYNEIRYNFLSSDEFIEYLIKKINEKNYFTNYIIVNDFKDIDKKYLINKDRIILAKEATDEFSKKPYIEIELPNGVICKTRVEYREGLRDKLDNNEQFEKDFEQLKVILSDNKKDVLTGVVLYDDAEQNMLYLYRNHVGIKQALSSIFNDKQKEQFFGEVGKVVGELINLDNKILQKFSLMIQIRSPQQKKLALNSILFS